MSLGEFSIICFGFLEKISKRENHKIWANTGPFAAATLRCRHCSQRKKFRIFVPKVSYSYTDSLRTLINY